jgi:hypothetical protein
MNEFGWLILLGITSPVLSRHSVNGVSMRFSKPVSNLLILVILLYCSITFCPDIYQKAIPLMLGHPSPNPHTTGTAKSDGR